jgi:hypothetical protein
MHSHFPGPEKALAYLDCFQRVVAQTSKANPGERANTLKMVKYLKDSINAAIAHADVAGDASAEAYVPNRRAWHGQARSACLTHGAELLYWDGVCAIWRR